jgi:MerR family transcriptional regulator, copper efflux regulator
MPARTRKLEQSEARENGFHNIGQAAAASGVSAKMIRHYESIGLITAPDRTHANYRIYSEREVHVLRFVKRARTLGFSIKEIEGLLALWRDKRRASAAVKKLALAHAQELGLRIEELASMKRTLEDLAKRCRGDERPDCPILDDLSGECEH